MLIAIFFKHKEQKLLSAFSKMFFLSCLFFLLKLPLGCSAPIGIAGESNFPSSYPYITPHTFMNFCDVVLDPDTGKINKKVQPGDVVFVRTDKLALFFDSIRPTIDCKYILMTAFHDNSIPGPYASRLDDPNLIAWFGINVDGTHHPKLHLIPIGITSRCFEFGNVAIVDESIKMRKSIDKTILLYMNFSVQNDPERKLVYNMFRNKRYCKNCAREIGRRCYKLDMRGYWRDLGASKFVLSPRGYGLDCYRTWEAMMMGAIPIVISSSIDSVFDDLPVLIIKDWKEINPQFLESKWKEMSQKKYNLDKLYSDYWFNIINSYKKTS